MRRVSYRARYVLMGMELEPLEGAFVDVGEDGVVTGVGRAPGSVNTVDLGNTVLMPQLVNAHVHVLDYPLLGLYGKYYIDDLVGAPYGIKYHFLRRAREEDLTTGLRSVFRRVRRYGVGCLLSIIEYGFRYAELVVKEAQSEGLCITPFAEPSTFRVYVHEGEEDDVDEGFEREVRDFVERGFNVSLISPLNYTKAELKLAAKLTSAHGLWVMTHVSETEDTYADNDMGRAGETLNPANTVMVHLTQLGDEDILKLAPSPIVTCPRSNVELVGKLPRISTMVKRGFRLMVGTDNVALVEPNPWDEIKTLRELLRYGGYAIDDRELLKMVTTNPARWGFGYRIDYGEVMKAVVVGVGYDSVNTDNLIHYLVSRVTPVDVVGLVDGSSLIKFNP
ncbi:amidohydrolase family protein [Vulcanisaeta thermophila]|uniref:amidohydrolase family protein n=1 Tax=Vulcanisaeta thermophila TaxID=867917 RepID=UPI00085366A4|nr:amidohydrolase family protein [Vulcanisaeta thermophila]